MVALETAEMLKERRIHCVTVIAPDCPLAQRLSAKGCGAISWGSSSFKNIMLLRRLFKSGNIRTVLVQQLRDLFFIRIALVGITEIKVVGISHTFVGVSKKDIYHRWIYNRVQTLIALTDIHRKNLIEHLEINPNKIVVIPNSVDTEKFNPKHRSDLLRASFGADNHTVLIGLIGRLDKAKGQKILLEASAVLKNKFSNFKVLLVGEETLNEPGILADLKSTVSSLELSEKIIFTGYRSDIPEIMASLDILVMSSDAETFGRVIIEGMASGAAVVASRAGGVVDIVDDGVTGLLFTPGKANALAERLFELCLSVEVRKLYADKALNKVQQKYRRAVNDNQMFSILHN